MPLVSDVGLVSRSVCVDVFRRSVVAGEDDERLLVEAVLPKFLEDGADRVIEGADHRRIDAFGLVLELREPRVVFFRGFQRNVRSIEGEVEEERLVLVTLNEVDSLACQLFGQEPV